jgi:cytochrome c551/c552
MLCLLLVVVGSGCTTSPIVSALLFGQRESVPVAHTGDAAHGELLFRQGINGAPGCISCHALAAGGYGVGPALGDIGQRAAERVSGLSREDYLHQSIIEPGAFLVPGYRDMMFPTYGSALSPQDIDDLVAFMLSLP